MTTYSVKQLALMAGVSVRTLHIYDKMGLLKPQARTQARYRVYGTPELLRLQQILFYKELDFPLQEIKTLLDHPDFDVVKALEQHKQALQTRQSRISTLLATIDNTILKLNEGKMLTNEELYKGLSKEQAASYRKESIEKYGAEAVETSENHLRKMGKPDYEKLGAEAKTVTHELFKHSHRLPDSIEVQQLIARHYDIIRMFWGTSGQADPQAEAYKGLGQLYVNDERFIQIEGQHHAAFALFLSKAMAYYADHSLSQQ